MITVTGRTFDHRDLLRAWRGRWNNAERSWEFDSLSSEQISRLRSFVGVIVTDAPRHTPSDDDETRQFIRAILRGQHCEPKPITRNGRTAVYGDDPRYLNHFADQNPTAFFGFSSLTAFIDYVDALDDPDHGRNAGWKQSAAWAGTATLTDAVRLARTGWQDGLEGVHWLDIPDAQRPRRRSAVAGGSVSVGRLLSGDPQHMNRRAPQPARRIVTLFVETFMSSDIDADNAIIRARLVASITDAMERQGYSCEIVAALTTRVGSSAVGHQAAITLKQAGERLNLLDVIFALGHPSFFRRLCFAAVGCADECQDTWRTQGSSSAAFTRDHPCGRNEYYIKQLSLEDQWEFDDSNPLDILRLIKPEGLSL